MEENKQTNLSEPKEKGEIECLSCKDILRNIKQQLKNQFCNFCTQIYKPDDQIKIYYCRKENTTICEICLQKSQQLQSQNIINEKKCEICTSEFTDNSTQNEDWACSGCSTQYRRKSFIRYQCPNEQYDLCGNCTDIMFGKDAYTTNEKCQICSQILSEFKAGYLEGNLWNCFKCQERYYGNKIPSYSCNNNNHGQTICYKCSQKNSYYSEKIEIDFSLITKPTKIQSLRQGQQMFPNDYMISQCENYELKLQDNGNLEFYLKNFYNPDNLIWQTNTKNIGTSPYRLIFQKNANVILVDSKFQVLWESQSKIDEDELQGKKFELIIQEKQRQIQIINISNKQHIWVSNEEQPEQIQMELDLFKKIRDVDQLKEYIDHIPKKIRFVYEKQINEIFQVQQLCSEKIQKEQNQTNTEQQELEEFELQQQTSLENYELQQEKNEQYFIQNQKKQKYCIKQGIEQAKQKIKKDFAEYSFKAYSKEQSQLKTEKQVKMIESQIKEIEDRQQQEKNQRSQIEEEDQLQNEEDDQYLCKACYTETACFIALNCKHLVGCANCSEKFYNKCPVCRKNGPIIKILN